MLTMIVSGPILPLCRYEGWVRRWPETFRLEQIGLLERVASCVGDEISEAETAAAAHDVLVV